jgi:cytoskeletal protein CcmA (bactofilin family)
MWNRDAAPLPDPAARPGGTTPAPRPHDERRQVAWVGKSVVFKGELTSSEDMTIDGRVEGTIELRDHALTVGPDAEIRAKIHARTVVVIGTVLGTITARERVDIHDTGSVTGDITSPKIAMADGAMLKGRVDTGAQAAESADARRLSAVGT